MDVKKTGLAVAAVVALGVAGFLFLRPRAEPPLQAPVPPPPRRAPPPGAGAAAGPRADARRSHAPSGGRLGRDAARGLLLGVAEDRRLAAAAGPARPVCRAGERPGARREPAQAARLPRS